MVLDAKVLLNPSTSLIPTVLSEMHSSPVGGHFGFHKTLARLRSDFFWEGMRKSVQKFIQECEVCQQFKYDNMMPAGLLQPLPVPKWIWTEISMDFIEGLTSSSGSQVIMVVVDRLSKYAHFIPLLHPFTAATVAKEFILHVVKLHGVPVSIITDRDKIFMSGFWRSFFQQHGSKLRMSSS